MQRRGLCDRHRRRWYHELRKLTTEEDKIWFEERSIQIGLILPPRASRKRGPAKTPSRRRWCHELATTRTQTGPHDHASRDPGRRASDHRRGEAPHEHIVRRWYSKGIRGVRFEVSYIGGEVFVTDREICCFFQQIQITAASGRENDRPRPPKGRRGIQTLTANLAASRVLSRLGQSATANQGQMS